MEQKIEFDFGQGGAGQQGQGEAPDFSGQESLGKCPKCGARVFEQPMAFVCEQSLGPLRGCDFRSGRIILQRPIEREQIQQLLSTGKTDLLHRFISKKGRPFSAFLVRGTDGKVGFEFAPRAAKSAIPSIAKSAGKSAARSTNKPAQAPAASKARKRPRAPRKKAAA